MQAVLMTDVGNSTNSTSNIKIRSHRVRSLIPYLDYGDLTKRKILPPEKMFTAKTVLSRGGKTPCATLAKKIGASEYGLFVECIITELLQNECNFSVINDIKNGISKDYQHLFKTEEWKPLCNLLKSEFTDNNIKCTPQIEWVDANDTYSIEGHPDLVSYTCVYDVKTTGRFSAMRTDNIFQLLSYYSLAQIKYPHEKSISKKNKSITRITHIGLILPLQLSVVTYNLSDWNWKPFYKELQKCILLKEEREAGWNNLPQGQLFMFSLYIQQYVGAHCRIHDLLKYIEHGMPALQFFINGNATSVVKYTDKFLQDTKNTVINAKHTKVFIHSPYVLNLSDPGKGQGERESDDKNLSNNWTYKCLKDILKFGIATGIKGVVVHCGRACKIEYYKAVFKMWCSVITCAQYATPECKLLIETSSGQGSEILCAPDELASFYLSLPEDTRKNVGICVDTCHTFAAGYDPYEFVMVLVNAGVSVDLFHYNDSATKKGSLKDRHAPIGHGYIGYESLYRVLEYAIKNNIPMVRE